MQQQYIKLNTIKLKRRNSCFVFLILIQLRMKTNTEIRKIGVWLDHSSAELMISTSDSIESMTILSKFTHQDKLDGLKKSEKIMHKKEQHYQAEYYKEIEQNLLSFDEIILFGPTDAKFELLNILKADQNFKGIKIEIQQTDKMTKNEKNKFVKNHFKTMQRIS